MRLLAPIATVVVLLMHCFVIKASATVCNDLDVDLEYVCNGTTFDLVVTVSGAQAELNGENFTGYYAFTSLSNTPIVADCIDPPMVQIFCTNEFNPVCGCDGVNYSNGCYAIVAGADPSVTGECTGDEQVIITLRGLPVDTEFDLVVDCEYNFLALNDPTEIIIPAVNPCSAPVDPCICPDIIDNSVNCINVVDPVCGCDGVQYDNACVAQYRNGVSTWTEGPCPQSGPTVGAFCDDFDPLTYADTLVDCTCSGYIQNCVCPDLIDTSANCISVVDPVCGCNGVTYTNACIAETTGGVLKWTAGACPNSCFDNPLLLPWVVDLLDQQIYTVTSLRKAIWNSQPILLFIDESISFRPVRIYTCQGVLIQSCADFFPTPMCDVDAGIDENSLSVTTIWNSSDPLPDLDTERVPCDDGDSATIDDRIQDDCSCAGISQPTMRSFVTTWVTNNPGSSCPTCISVPTRGGGYNYDVDVDYVIGQPFVADTTGMTGGFTWDTGREDTVTIAIRGDFPRIYFNDFDQDSTNEDSDKLIDIAQWGDIEWRNMSSAFTGCRYLEASATDTADVSRVEDMSFAFRGCTLFNGDVSNWQVAGVGDMRGMFANASSFNADIGGWNVASVTDMSFMFASATSFNQDIGEWDVRQVEEMLFMFQSASVFDQDISEWEPLRVFDMSSMFADATAFNQDIGGWDVSSVTFMGGMFGGATSFNQDLSDWNTANVEQMPGMFGRAAAFDQDLGAWDISSLEDIGLLDNFGFLEASGISCVNYSSTLDAWSREASTPDNLSMQSFGLRFNETGQAAQTTLEAKGWSFSGDAFDPDCPSQRPCPTTIQLAEVYPYVECDFDHIVEFDLSGFTSPVVTLAYTTPQNGSVVDTSTTSSYLLSIYPDFEIVDVAISVQDTNGCSVDTLIAVDFGGVGEYDVFAPSLCPGDSVLMEVWVENPLPFGLTWQGPNGFNVMGESVYAYEPGIYTYVGFNVNGCRFEGELEVFESDSILVDFNNTPLFTCPDVPVQLDPTIQGGSGSYVTYAWFPTIGLDDPTARNPLALVSATTTYTLEVTDDEGCVGSSEIAISVLPPPLLGFDVTFTCDSTGIIDVTPSGNGPFEYSWEDGSADNPRTGLTVGNYTVTVTDGAGCTGTSDVAVGLGDDCCSEIEWVSLPADATINCADLTSVDLELEYANTGDADCLVQGSATADTMLVGDACNRRLILSWSVIGNSSTITAEQVLTVIIPDPQWINLPGEILDVPCDDVPTLVQMPLMYSNNGPGSCLLEGLVVPTIINDDYNCGDTVLVQYAYVSDCGQELTFDRLLITEDCSSPVLEDDSLVIVVGEPFEIDILANDNVESTTIDITSVDGSLIDAEVTVEGILSGVADEAFSEPIVITVEVCVADCEECGSQVITLSNEALSDIIQTTFLNRSSNATDRLIFNNETVMQDTEVWIYNRWGQEVYYSDSYGNDWKADGYPAGIYFYVIKRGELVIKQTLTVFD